MHGWIDDGWMESWTDKYIHLRMDGWTRQETRIKWKCFFPNSSFFHTYPKKNVIKFLFFLSILHSAQEIIIIYIALIMSCDTVLHM